MITLFTKNLKFKLYGESHSKYLTLSFKGIRKGTIYNPLILEEDLQRRKAKEFYETKRQELDFPNIIKGIKNNKFTGKTIKVIFENQKTSLKNYEIFNEIPRPGHADFARIKKYGSILKEGTDIFSGRMTLGYVAAGSFCKMGLPNIEVKSEIINLLGQSNQDLFLKIKKDVLEKGDSLGAIIKLTIKGIKSGLGDPFNFPFDSLISALLYRIPSIKSVSFGNPIELVKLKGSEYNDVIINEKGKSETNNSSGVIGGLTNGNDIVIYVFSRPASSIKMMQKTYNLKKNKMDQLNIKGNHDSFFQDRLLVILENILYIGIYDFMLGEKDVKIWN